MYVNSRDRILNAAERLILGDGRNNLGIEAVVDEAGISKGGFFHLFASKGELVDAVIGRLEQVTEEQTAELVASAGVSPLAATVHLAFDFPKVDRERLRALALARHLRSTETHQTRSRRTPGKALVVKLALDGFWLAESQNTLTPTQTQAFRDALLALI